MKANFSGTFLNVRRRSRFEFMRLLRFIFGARGSLFSANLGSGLRRCGIGRPRVGVGLASKPHSPQYASSGAGVKEFLLGRALPSEHHIPQAVKQRWNPPPFGPPRQLFSTCRVLLTGDRGTLVS